MSFVTAHPELLLNAAADLTKIGEGFAAGNTAAAAPTTAVVPPGADEVSALIAARLAAHGAQYQAVGAHAAAIHDLLVATLAGSGDSYAVTEAVNAAAAI